MIEVMEMKINHVYELAKNLRAEDKQECEAFGSSAQVILRKSYARSIMKRVVLIDGQIGAAWGLSGTVLGGVGHPWLLTSYAVEKNFFPLITIYKNQVKEMLSIYPRLENVCLASYTKSLRLLRIIGFTIGYPFIYGKHGEQFCKFYLEA